MTRLVGVFLEQATHCEHLGSRFMARLLRLLANHWPIVYRADARLEAWQGDIGPNGASLPLRLAAALHALVLTGQAAQLRTNYPPHQTSDNQLFKAVQTTMTHHHILSTIGSDTPQTNEVARSAELIPAAMWLQQHHQLPICLSDLGASAGLSLELWPLCADRVQAPLWARATGAASDTSLARPCANWNLAIYYRAPRRRS